MKTLKIMTQEERIEDLHEILDSIKYQACEIRNQIIRNTQCYITDRNKLLSDLQNIENIADYAGMRLYVITNP